MIDWLRREAVAAFDALDEARAVRHGVHQVDGRLVDGQRVGGSEDADVMHIRLGRIAVAVAIHGQAIQYADEDDVVAHGTVHTLGRVRHGLQERVLLAPDAAAGAGTAGVDPDLAHRRTEADGDVLDRPAEARHGVALEVGKHQEGVVVRKVTADIIHAQPIAALDWKLHAVLGVQDVHLRDVSEAVILCQLHVHGGGGTAAAIGGVALHDGAVQHLHQVADQRGPQVVGALALAGGQLDAHFPRQFHI